MNPLLALLALAFACWSAWLELSARLPDFGAALPLLLVGGALAVPCITRPAALARVPLLPLVILLLLYSAAVLCAPPLMRIAPAVFTVAYCLHAARGESAPSAAFYALVLLALPVLPSLEFYVAYPIRLAAIDLSAQLLRMNGVAVSVEGLALRFSGQFIQFDAPCSGVRMLWTCWFLTSALGYLYRFTARRFALALLVATLLAIAGNVLRATSLFYLEAKLLGPEPPAWMHEAVGIAAFCVTALLLLLALRPRQPFDSVAVQP